MVLPLMTLPSIILSFSANLLSVSTSWSRAPHVVVLVPRISSNTLERVCRSAAGLGHSRQPRTSEGVSTGRPNCGEAASALASSCAVPGASVAGGAAATVAVTTGPPTLALKRRSLVAILVGLSAAAAADGVEEEEDLDVEVKGEGLGLVTEVLTEEGFVLSAIVCCCRVVAADVERKGRAFPTDATPRVPGPALVVVEVEGALEPSNASSNGEEEEREEEEAVIAVGAVVPSADLEVEEDAAVSSARSDLRGLTATARRTEPIVTDRASERILRVVGDKKPKETGAAVEEAEGVASGSLVGALRGRNGVLTWAETGRAAAPEAGAEDDDEDEDDEDDEEEGEEGDVAVEAPVELPFVANLVLGAGAVLVVDAEQEVVEAGSFASMVRESNFDEDEDEEIAAVVGGRVVESERDVSVAARGTRAGGSADDVEDEEDKEEDEEEGLCFADVDVAAAVVAADGSLVCSEREAAGPRTPLAPDPPAAADVAVRAPVDVALVEEEVKEGPTEEDVDLVMAAAASAVAAFGAVCVDARDRLGFLAAVPAAPMTGFGSREDDAAVAAAVVVVVAVDIAGLVAILFVLEATAADLPAAAAIDFVRVPV